MAAGKQCICLESEIPVYITPFEHHRLVLCNAVRCLNQRPCISWRSECPGFRVVLRGFNSLTILTGFFIVTNSSSHLHLQIVIEHLCNLCYHKWRSCCRKSVLQNTHEPVFEKRGLLVNYQRSLLPSRDTWCDTRPRRAVQGLHKVNENEKWWVGFWMVTLDRT